MRVAFQAVIVVLVLLGLGNLTASLLEPNDAGTYGFGAARVSRATFRVTDIEPNSPAAKAGLRVGDTISVDHSFDNVVKMSAIAPGDRVIFHRGSDSIALTAVVTHVNALALLIVTFVAKIAFLLVAAILAWRRPDDESARALSLFLACFGMGINFDANIFPGIWTRFYSFLVVQSIFFVGGIALLAFTCRFPQPAARGLRRWLASMLPALTIVGLFGSTMSIVGTFLTPASLGSLAAVFGIGYIVFYTAVLAASLSSLIISYRQSPPEERPRMRLVLATFAVGFSGLFVLFGSIAVGLALQWAQYAALTVVAIPFGLAYVILRHRVLDIGFVVNRAVVYTAVSLVVVGAFTVFEWLLGHIVEANSRASALLELAGALVLGLSVRYIHGRVDAYVDDLFFRERHVAEEAIRRFAHEAPLITDPEVLVARTIDVAQRHARLSAAAFYARRDGRYIALASSFAEAPDLNENDEAVLDMRTWRQTVDLRGRATVVPGETVFPMVVRGQLAGFLACGDKTTHEALAPDERDALTVLARDTGVALDSLRIATIERELAFLSADGELPPALRTRLSALVAPDDGAQPAGLRLRSSQ